MLRTLRSCLLVLVVALLGLHTVPAPVAGAATPTATVDDGTDAGVGSLRARPSPRPYDNPNAQPRTDGDVRGSRALETTEEAGPPRLDDPVLQWLPEITDASTKTGTPISLIAGIMRIESGGDPSTISPQGAQGLMQVMPDELGAQGIPSDRWLDPKTNILAGAVILVQRSGGGWEAAAAYYFGIGCDYYGTCTYGYAVAVIGWANAYASLLGDPYWYDVNLIPAVPSSPEPTAEPATKPTASESTSDGEYQIDPTPKPAKTPTAAPSTQPTAEPPEEPTAQPTDVPTEAPTDVPADTPTPASDPGGNATYNAAATPAA
jgi:hypothetical protein